MSSRKSKRYGQGGSNHKGVKQAGRPNGKAYKQRPKAFSLGAGRLITSKILSGTSF